jgi:chromosome segregation ATPase
MSVFVASYGGYPRVLDKSQLQIRSKEELFRSPSFRKLMEGIERFEDRLTFELDCERNPRIHITGVAKPIFFDELDRSLRPEDIESLRGILDTLPSRSSHASTPESEQPGRASPLTERVIEQSERDKYLDLIGKALQNNRDVCIAALSRSSGSLGAREVQTHEIVTKQAEISRLKTKVASLQRHSRKNERLTRRIAHLEQNLKGLQQENIDLTGKLEKSNAKTRLLESQLARHKGLKNRLKKQTRKNKQLTEVVKDLGRTLTQSFEENLELEAHIVELEKRLDQERAHQNSLTVQSTQTEPQDDDRERATSLCENAVQSAEEEQQLRLESQAFYIARITELNSQLADMEAQLQASEGGLEELAAKKTELEAQVATLRQQLEQVSIGPKGQDASVQTENDGQSTALETQINFIARIAALEEQLDDMESECDKESQALENLHQAYGAGMAELQTLKTQLSDAALDSRTQLAELEQLDSQCERAVQAAEEEKQLRLESQTQYTTRIAALEEQLAQARASRETNEASSQTENFESRQREEALQGQLDEARQKLTRHNERLGAAEQERQAHEENRTKHLARITALEGQLQARGDESDKARQSLEELRKAYATKSAELETELSRIALDSHAQIFESQQREAGLQAQLDKVRQDLANRDDGLAEFQRTLEEVRNKGSADLSSLQARLDAATTDLTQSKSTEASLTTQLSELEQASAQAIAHLRSQGDQSTELAALRQKHASTVAALHQALEEARDHQKQVIEQLRLGFERDLTILDAKHEAIEQEQRDLLARADETEQELREELEAEQSKSTGLAQEVATLREQLTLREGEISSLRGQVHNLTVERDHYKDRAERAEKENVHLKLNLAQAQKQLAAAQQELETKQNEMRRMQNQFDMAMATSEGKHLAQLKERDERLREQDLQAKRAYTEMYEHRIRSAQREGQLEESIRVSDQYQAELEARITDLTADLEQLKAELLKRDGILAEISEKGRQFYPAHQARIQSLETEIEILNENLRRARLTSADLQRKKPQAAAASASSSSSPVDSSKLGEEAIIAFNALENVEEISTFFNQLVRTHSTDETNQALLFSKDLATIEAIDFAESGKRNQVHKNIRIHFSPAPYPFFGNLAGTVLFNEENLSVKRKRIGNKVVADSLFEYNNHLHPPETEESLSPQTSVGRLFHYLNTKLADRIKQTEDPYIEVNQFDYFFKDISHFLKDLVGMLKSEKLTGLPEDQRRRAESRIVACAFYALLTNGGKDLELQVLQLLRTPSTFPKMSTSLHPQIYGDLIYLGYLLAKIREDKAKNPHIKEKMDSKAIENEILYERLSPLLKNLLLNLELPEAH